LNKTGFWREIQKKPGFWGVLYKPGIRCNVTINSNANRQKIILANSAKIVEPQSYLAYMSCTYSTA